MHYSNIYSAFKVKKIEEKMMKKVEMMKGTEEVKKEKKVGLFTED